MSRRQQCAHATQIEEIPGLIAYCLLRLGHDGPCVIGLLGSDEFHEWLVKIRE